METGISIPYVTLEDIERGRAEMEIFRKELQEADNVARQESTEEYYCGICKCMMPLSHFPH